MPKQIAIEHVDTIDRLREELAALASMLGACELLQGREIRGLASMLDAHLFELDRIAEDLSTEDGDPNDHGGAADV